MKTKYLLLIFSLISLFILSACKNPFRYTDAREIPVDAKERVRKNIEEGRGVTLFGGEKKGGVFDFASSNELWRASIEVLDKTSKNTKMAHKFKKALNIGFFKWHKCNIIKFIA